MTHSHTHTDTFVSNQQNCLVSEFLSQSLRDIKATVICVQISSHTHTSPSDSVNLCDSVMSVSPWHHV